ncbi:MAG TPA: hypothetical protein VI055_19390 [Rubrobacter sp.]
MTAGVRQRNRGIDGRTWLAWSLAALSVAMFVVGAALTVSSLYVGAAPQPSTASTWGTAGALSSLVIFLPFLAFPLVGALIASRRPENPIGWICLAAGLFWMSIVVEASIPGSASYPVIIDALLQWTWVPPVGLLGIYMILLFPDGKLPSRRWHPFAWFAGAVMVLTSVAVTLSPGTLEDHPGVSNPLGLEGHSIVAQVLARAPVLLPICILASALSLVWRYRHSGGEVRLQIRWVAFAASLVSVAYAVTAVSGIFFAPEASTNEQAPPLWLALLQDAVLVSYAGVPIAVGFAVLRYRLYDIDLIINRTLVYGSLTVLLASAYVGGVVGLQAIFRGLTGQESTLAVVASTLAIAALFNPLRRRVQTFVDRRFYRKKYDARKTLETFSGRLRDETDLHTLSSDLVAVVRETMQPAHVSLWVRPGPSVRVRKQRKDG